MAIFQLRPVAREAYAFPEAYKVRPQKGTILRLAMGH
jgi:hypothetical protein